MGSHKRAPLTAFVAVTVACLFTLYLALTTKLPLPAIPGTAAIAHEPMKIVRIVGQVMSDPRKQPTTATAPATQQPIRKGSPSPTPAAAPSDATAPVVHVTRSEHRRHKTATRPNGHAKHHPGKVDGHAKSHGKAHGKAHAHGKPSKPSIDLPIIGNVPLPTLTDVADGAPGNSGHAPGHNKQSDPGHGHGPDKTKAAASSLSATAHAVLSALAAPATTPAAQAPSHGGPAHLTGWQRHGKEEAPWHAEHGASGEHGQAHEPHGESGEHGHAHEPHGHAHGPHGH